MNFIEYKQDVLNEVSRKYRNAEELVNSSMNDIYESYIDNICTSECAKILVTNILKENAEVDETQQYARTYIDQVLKLLYKLGYKIKKLPGTLKNDILDYFENNATIYDCADYCATQLKKKYVKTKDKKAEDEKLILLKNRLFMLFHNIESAALNDVEKDKDTIYAVVKVKLFEMKNEINTDIKSYMREINKYFIPYVRQNTDNGSRLEILGYSIKQRNLYCTCKIKIDLMDEERFSVTETTNIINMYIEIFKMFSEQYQNII